MKHRKAPPLCCRTDNLPFKFDSGSVSLTLKIMTPNRGSAGRRFATFERLKQRTRLPLIITLRLGTAQRNRSCA